MAIKNPFVHKKLASITRTSGALATEFCSNTSIHGLKYIVEEESHWFERLGWIFLFFAGVCFSGFFCWQMWKKWEESPVIQSLDSHLYTFGSVVFPAVTLCNVNKVSRKKLEYVLQNSELYANVSFNVVQTTLRYMTKLDRAIGNEEELEKLSEYYSSRNISSKDLFHLLRQTAPSCSDMILDCNWAGLTAQCMNQFNFLPTDDGICCIFNGASYTDESLGISSTSKKLLNVTGKGYRTGLSLVLNANVEDYSVTSGKFDGFTVLVHSPDKFPDIADRGFVLGPGFEMFTGFKRASSFSTEEAISKVPPLKRKCQADGEKMLKYYGKYSQSGCYVECATRRMQDICGCRPYFYKADEHVPLCPLESFPCLSSVYKDIEQNGQHFCDCLPSCTDEWYDPEISYAPFPGRGLNLTRTFKRFATSLNLSREADYNAYFKSNVAVLHVYQKEMTGMRYKTDIRFGVEDFISSVGGLLGLGLGFSFISFIEIVYFCCIRYHALRYRTKAANESKSASANNLRPYHSSSALENAASSN